MDKTELETKYHKLATEYSKIRSQANVLKKAVLDEQSKNVELKETVKSQEQKLRKYTQESESLTFRNEQLTKRIAVLQQELQVNNSHGKKSKNKNSNEPVVQNNFTVLDEELHKKIMENAELVCSVSDKEFEISNCNEKIEWQENKLAAMQRELDQLHLEKDTNKTVPTKKTICTKCNSIELPSNTNSESTETEDKDKDWKNEAEKWRKSYELVTNRPTASGDNSSDNIREMSRYYEQEVYKYLCKKQAATSESDSLRLENRALTERLESALFERRAFENIAAKSADELHSTNTGYQTQLDAMTEHVAGQNDKITKQCDEIQLLKHQLSLRK